MWSCGRGCAGLTDALVVYSLLAVAGVSFSSVGCNVSGSVEIPPASRCSAYYCS